MTKERHKLYKSGTFFSYIFLAATIVSIAMQIVSRLRMGRNIWTAFISPTTISLYIIGTLWFLSTIYSRFSLFQPLVMLGVFFFNSYNSSPGQRDWAGMFTTGFFICAVIMLYKGGYLEKRRILKVISLAVFYYAAITVGIIHSGETIDNVLGSVFFITAFIAFLYITYKDEMTVYLRYEKPSLSLSAFGLTPLEAKYARDIVAGKNFKEIALDFKVSESTVRNTTARIYKKLNVVDKSSLTALLASHTLVD